MHALAKCVLADYKSLVVKMGNDLFGNVITNNNY
jgi:hypothetical protein